jgi:hypothetical protein
LNTYHWDGRLILDEPSRFVEAFVDAKRLFSAAAVGNDRLRPTLLQLHAQLGAVKRLVANQLLRWFASPDEPLCRRAVVCFAAGQQDGEKTAISICECKHHNV